HRVIKSILNNERYVLPALPPPGEAHAKLARRLEKTAAARVKAPTQKPRKASAEVQAWEAAGLHCSANERRADEASRDVEAWLKCKYMREHLGEEYAGSVSAVTSFGLFVTLTELHVEGLVHITELGGEYFRYDEVRQELRGERTGIRYGMGTRVRVQVSRVDLDARKIDFRLVHEEGAPRDKSGRESGTGKAAPKPPKGRERREAREDLPPATERRTPMQALTAAVKKAAAKAKARKGGKPRR
ncbi:MAG TPA: S1 RNA-binding domain-containing protein, partial [Ottowia sp.]|nr:S1 RNA-binding domain-containing protein [Ottowia sp.]